MKLAVIVGGSAGLGLILAEQLALEGAARIVLVARKADRLMTVKAQLEEKFPETQFHGCALDIAAPDGAATLAACVATHAEPVDLLINAVGLSDRGTTMGLKVERVEELIRANIIAPLLATQTIVPLMQSGSVIVNIGSLSSYFAPSYLGGYSIAKHGLRALTGQLRIELAGQGIHVMLVCPGPIAREDAGSRYSHLPGAADIPQRSVARRQWCQDKSPRPTAFGRRHFARDQSSATRSHPSAQSSVAAYSFRRLAQAWRMGLEAQNTEVTIFVP